MAVTILYRPYCSLAQLQKELRNSDADDDDLVKDWHHDCINRASRTVERMCRRDFWWHDHSGTPYQVQEEEVYNREVILKWPIRTLTKVELQGTTMLPSGYRAKIGKRSILFASQIVMDRLEEDSIELTGTFGYTFTVTPPEITRACILIAAAWSNDNRKEVLALQGGTESLLNTEIPSEARMLLGPFITPVL